MHWSTPNTLIIIIIIYLILPVIIDYFNALSSFYLQSIYKFQEDLANVLSLKASYLAIINAYARFHHLQ